MRYLKNIVEIKALVSQMPSIGSEVDTIIQGIAKTLLALVLKHNITHYQWFVAEFKPLWITYDNILNSTFLSPEVIDSKVKYISILFRTLYTYADSDFKAILRQEFIPYLHLAFDRIENNILLPLSKYDLIQD